MKRYFLIYIPILLLLGCPPHKAVPPVCGNNLCEAGETAQTCPQDCAPTPKPPVVTVCGNGICEQGENQSNCPQDCKPPQ